MQVTSYKSMRRSTRLRVEIPVKVTSLDRLHPFHAPCTVLVVSPQGCGFRSSQALQVETPIILEDLPGGVSVTARVANCLPLGETGFLIGAALYNHGNVWGVEEPPADWNDETDDEKAPAAKKGVAAAAAPVKKKAAWPYNKFSEGAETSPGRK